MSSQSDVAKHLRAIEDMAGRLEAKAIDQGRRVGTNDDRGIVGGEAAVNLAPVGSIRTWAARVEELERAWSEDESLDDDDMPNWSEYEDPDEFWSAEQTVCFWAEDFRRQLEMDHEGWRPSLLSEAKFLRNGDVAEWIWSNEIHWDEYAADIATAKTKLETILHEGDRSEYSRVVCDQPACPDPRRLVRVYADRTVIGWACLRCNTLVDGRPREHCPNPMCWSVAPPIPAAWTSDADADQWKCGGCKHRYSHAEVRDAWASQMRSAGTDRWLPLGDAISILTAQGWQERVVRGWLEPLSPVDVCTECGAEHPGQEFPACPSPRLVDGAIVQCGGDLVIDHWDGNKDAVPRARCDIATRTRWVWWPDMWQAHLNATLERKLEALALRKREDRRKLCEERHPDDCWIPGRGCSVWLKTRREKACA